MEKPGLTGSILCPPGLLYVWLWKRTRDRHNIFKRTDLGFYFPVHQQLSETGSDHEEELFSLPEAAPRSTCAPSFITRGSSEPLQGEKSISSGRTQNLSLPCFDPFPSPNPYKTPSVWQSPLYRVEYTVHCR